MKRRVVVYRHQLFKASEVFILSQARSLKQFEPIFVGRRMVGEPIRGVDVITLEGLSLFKEVRNRCLRDCSPWLDRGLRELRPSLIHAHFGFEGVYAFPLARKLRVPLVTTFHGVDASTSLKGLLLSGKISWINYGIFQRQLRQQGDLFICVSDYIRRRLVARGFPETRTVTHYIGVDTERIMYTSAREQPLVLHVARLVEKKGTRYLIEAMGRVIRRHPDAELVIVGDGPLRQRLEILTAELELTRHVRFLGSQPHQAVLDLMAKAMVLVVPSVTARSGDTEGLPTVVLEAAASGCPVVATRHSGIPEAVVDGETGILVDEKDVNTLADSICELLGNSSLRNDMGRAARRLVETRFDLYRQTAILEGMYAKLL